MSESQNLLALLLCVCNGGSLRYRVCSQYQCKAYCVCVIQGFEAQGKPIPAVLLAHEPSMTARNLCRQAAIYHHNHSRRDDMLASLQRLDSDVDRLNFLLEFGYVREAEPLMLACGTCVGYSNVFQCYVFG